MERLNSFTPEDFIIELSNIRTLEGGLLDEKHLLLSKIYWVDQQLNMLKQRRQCLMDRLFTPSSEAKTISIKYKGQDD